MQTVTPSNSGSLSPGAIAGIVVGIIGGLLLGVAAVFIFWHRRRNAVLPSGNEQPVEFDSVKPGTPRFGESQSSEVGGRLGTQVWT